jgi:hypothetical protein
MFDLLFLMFYIGGFVLINVWINAQDRAIWNELEFRNLVDISFGYHSVSPRILPVTYGFKPLFDLFARHSVGCDASGATNHLRIRHHWQPP